MFPDSIAAVLGFLLAVAPGLVFEAVREHRRPTAERSAFREASEVALASLVFGALAVGILLGVRAIRPTLLPDPQEWLRLGSRYAVDHLGQVAVAIGGWVLLASLVAYAAARASSRQTEARIDPYTTGWFEVFRRRRPKGTLPMALVRLDDRSEYVGEVIYYDTNLITAEREIVLGPPLWHRNAEQVQLEPLPPEDEWRRVVLPGARITAVWVRYPPRPSRGPA